MTDAEDQNPSTGEVLGPEQASDGPVGDNYIALISQYTERPDLLLETLEKNDPGFIKRMNAKAEERSERMSEARFRFGGIQAYSSLAVSVIAALVLLGLTVYMVVNEIASFWAIIALIVFYAVSQSGPSGFFELCRGIADFFRRNDRKPD
ncbi:hypothetical protein [Roseovarius nubinhibens]|nr:hypothetical protein [Roseovarius nubinhibens]